MKLNKFNETRKKYPWILQFVGIPKMLVGQEDDVGGRKRKIQKQKEWVRSNLEYINFRNITSPNAIKDLLNASEHVTCGQEINMEINTYYPCWSYRVCYILYHYDCAFLEDAKKSFSAKYCLDHGATLTEKISWLKSRYFSEKLVIDGILAVTWSARTINGDFRQRISGWFPQGFTF